MAEPSRLQDDPSDAPNDLVVVTISDSYLKTLPGAVKFLQIVVSIIILICVTSAGPGSAGSYLYLPLSWHLRVYVFTNVFCMFISLLSVVLHLTSLLSTLDAAINWSSFELCMSSVLAFFYLFGASLVASAVDIYHKLNEDVSEWSKQQLTISVVFGYFGVLLHAISAFMAYKRQGLHPLLGSSQFSSRKFSELSAAAATSTD